METSLSSDAIPAPEVPKTPAPAPDVSKDDLLSLARAAVRLFDEASLQEPLRTFQSVVEWDTRPDSERVAALAEDLKRCAESATVRNDPLFGLVLRTIGPLVDGYREQGRWSPAPFDVGCLAGFLDHLAQQRRANLFEESRDCLSNWKALEGHIAHLCSRAPDGLAEWMADQLRPLLEKVQMVIRLLTEWLDDSGAIPPAPERLLDLFLWQPSLPVPKQESDPVAWRKTVDSHAAWSLCVLQTLRLLQERGVTVTVPIPMADRFDALVHEQIGEPLVPGSERESERIKEVFKLGFSVGGTRRKPCVMAYKSWGAESAGSLGHGF